MMLSLLLLLLGANPSLPVDTRNEAVHELTLFNQLINGRIFFCFLAGVARRLKEREMVMMMSSAAPFVFGGIGRSYVCT
jgi:hypothetical protein